MATRILVSGAGGFVGHHFFEHLLVNTDWQIVVTDSFRHKGKTDRIAQVLDGTPTPPWANGGGWRSRVEVITHDLTAPFSAQARKAIAGRNGLDYVIALAAESHVDRSISDPVPFVRNNVDVILNTLELARELKPHNVLVVSTDEVYGPVPTGHPGHPEWSPVLPSNPYAASKAAQEAIAISYWRTYGTPVTLTNLMNVYGERQDAEKFLPLLIHSIGAAQTVKIHGTPGNVGTRHYIHARNAASAWLWLLQHRKPAAYPEALMPDRWNVAGLEPVSNLELGLEVASIMGRELKYELTDFHSARPGHDPHYGLDMAKLTEAGWKPPVEFHEALRRAVLWTVAHPDWLLP